MNLRETCASLPSKHTFCQEGCVDPAPFWFALKTISVFERFLSKAQCLENQRMEQLLLCPFPCSKPPNQALVTLEAPALPRHSRASWGLPWYANRDEGPGANRPSGPPDYTGNAKGNVAGPKQPPKCHPLPRVEVQTECAGRGRTRDRPVLSHCSQTPLWFPAE